MRLSRRQLLLACLRQAKQALPSVSSALGANPALFPQEPQGSRQSRTIHGKAGDQPLLIGFSHCGQRGEQTELGDLKTCRSQFLVVNPRYQPAEAAKVLTRARQLKKWVGSLLAESLCLHVICIYIFCGCVSSRISTRSLRSTRTLEGQTRGD